MLDGHELAQRATLYAEQVIEGLDLEVLVSAEDMERITAAIASAFVVGCGAGVEMADVGSSVPRKRGGKKVR